MAATTMNARLQIKPSIRQQDVVRSAEEYMTGQVEPILDELVVYLCLQRPRRKELPKYIVEWLVQKKDGKSLMPEPDPKSPFKRTDIDAPMRLLRLENSNDGKRSECACCMRAERINCDRPR